ncbi:HigA family addiction module antidote protein [bacterium]|nr:HigA family addiction module antidote protein [bacterium]
MEMFNPPHPGKTLKILYLDELKMSIAALALRTGISRKHLSNIVNCKVPVSVEVALKLAKCFNTSPEVWLREQLAYDLWHAKQTVNLDNIEPLAL